jgi:hypothetical protein
MDKGNTIMRISFLLLPMMLLYGSASVLAEDFRVENAVFVGEDQKPSSESTTYFQNGVVYDCMKSPAETVIFEKAADRVILLNSARNTRAELTSVQMNSLLEHLRAMAAKSREPLIKFLAAPMFEEEMNDVAGILTLSSPLATYRVILVPQQSLQAVQQYCEFCDGSAKLNSILLPGTSPPFGRMKLDEALLKHQATPSSVMLTITTGRPGTKQTKTTVRSEHRLVLPLAPADADRITDLQTQREKSKLVTFEEYRKTTQR